MEYAQERIATLHDFGDAHPPAPTERATVVVPMAERDHATLAAERVLGTLEAVDPERVVVALRASAASVPGVVDWLDPFDLPLTVLWCTADPVEAALDDAGLDGPAGKGRDVWLALGLAARSEYVVVHDADAKSYAASHAPRLLYPLGEGYRFSKGYYARVENGRLYGRLARLFVAPLLRALRASHDAPVLSYLRAFRYPLAGEFATTAEVARRIRAQPGWGLELGSLGEAFDAAGFEKTAQVDLGIHEHDHRSVTGPDGLGDMATAVGEALLRVCLDHGLDPDVDGLRERYRAAADRLVDQYAADADFNGLDYDAAAERDQVQTYADALAPPGPDRRLPAWADAPLEPATIEARSVDAIEAATER
jgi:glucosyl-3-phosphoglycerate synthase